MKNKYDDIIMKYLSGLLDKDEAEKFEAEIENNEDLRNRFDEFRLKMADIKDLIPKESDQGYFIHLIPEVREKLDARSGKRISFPIPKAISYGLAAAILVFFFVQIGGDNEIFDSETVITALEKTDNEELNEFVELRYSDAQLYDIIDDIDLDNYSEAINEQVAENSDILYNYTEYANYGLEGIADISENQENDIYNNLIDKKIL